MRLRDDDRGQSVQIGAVLLFGLLVVAFSSYQAFVVPNQNSAVEFSHNQDVRDQMQDLRNELVSIHGERSTRSVSLTLGTRYPSRLIATNPGPPSGTIRTVGTSTLGENVTITNASATGETGDFWNGSERVYNTGTVAYQPNYNVYDGAPETIYEQTVLYNQFRSSNLTASGQTLIDDERISVVTINGSLSQTRTGSISLDLQPVSTSSTTVSVSNATAGGNVTVYAATQLREERWGELLESQLSVNGGHVVDYDVESVAGSEFDRLWIELEPGVSYDLRMTKVGVGTGVTDESSAYLTDVAGNGTRLDEGDATTVTLEVRDEYNNPVSGVQVNASTALGSLSPQEAWTDDDGEATFTYDSDGVAGGQWVDLDFSLLTDPGTTFDASTPENVTMQVRVQNPPAAGTTGGVYTTVWDRPPYSTARIASEELPSGSDASVPFRMRVTDGGNPVSNVAVDYAVNNSSVATPAPATGVSNATGYNATGMVWQDDGYLRAYTTTDTGGDRLNVTVDRLLNESFEDDAETLAANGWYYNDSGNGGGAAIKDIASGTTAGTRVAYINGSGATAGDRAVELNYSLNTSAYDGLSITFVARETDSVDNPDVPQPGSAWDPAENLRLQYRASDGRWVTIENVSSQTDGGEPISYVRRATIENVANASHNDFAIRFRQGEPTAVDEWQIDSVDLVGIGVETRIADLNQDPIAAFEPPSSPTAGQASEFDAARSDDPDGELTSYAWDFGDGATATGVDPSHTYSSAGTYTVTLTVTDDGGETNTTTRTVTVAANAAPTASFTASPDPATTGETINLDASGSSDTDGTITSYEWDTDGDGNYDDATGSTASVSYSSSGEKTISLRVTDDGGKTNTTDRTVTVNAPSGPAMTASNGAAFNGDNSEVVFYLTNTGSSGTIERVSIDSVSNASPDRLRNDPVLDIDNSNRGEINSQNWDIGSGFENVDNSGTIPGDGIARIQIGDFTEQGGGNPPVDMSSATVDLTVEYGDTTQESFSVPMNAVYQNSITGGNVDSGGQTAIVEADVGGNVITGGGDAVIDGANVGGNIDPQGGDVTLRDGDLGGSFDTAPDTLRLVGNWNLASYSGTTEAELESQTGANEVIIVN